MKAGKQLSKIEFDIVFTSIQIRAIETAMLVLSEGENNKTPVIIHEDGIMKDKTKIYSKTMSENIISIYKHWQLNERYYGKLQGENKSETKLKYGEDQVYKWRRSYNIPPPAGESLEDTAKRTVPFFENSILNRFKKGETILISTHGNNLRSIVMYIEKLTKNEVLKLEIPTGEPLIYEYDNVIKNINQKKR